MKNKAIAGFTAAVALAGWMGTAQAGSVTLIADNSMIAVGQTVTFTYMMDFSDDPTIGGGTDFYYDSAILQFVGWSFDAGLSSDDPGFRRMPDDCTTSADAGCSFDAGDFGGLEQVNGLAWGNFAGMSGPEVIGQLVFQAVGLGDATIFMTANDDGVPNNPGPFFSAGMGNPEQTVTFNHGNVQVNPAVVPVPAAAWLLLSGIGALGGLRSRSRA